MLHGKQNESSCCCFSFFTIRLGFCLSVFVVCCVKNVELGESFLVIADNLLLISDNNVCFVDILTFAVHLDLNVREVDCWKGGRGASVAGGSDIGTI